MFPTRRGPARSAAVLVAFFAAAALQARTSPAVRAAGKITFHDPAVYQVLTNPQSLASADVDGDGVLDLVVSAGGALSVSFGVGDGTFGVPVIIPTGGAPGQLLAADLDGNSALDLVAVDPTANSVYVVLNRGNREFGSPAAYSVGSQPAGVAAGDFNRDGRQDLAVADTLSNDLAVLINHGSGTFGAASFVAAPGGPLCLTTGDFDFNTKVDLAVCAGSPGSVSFYYGNGVGKFTAGTTLYRVGDQPSGILASDLNSDGVPDLATSNSTSGSVSVLYGDVQGQFSPANTYAGGQLPAGIATADLDMEGFPDLAVPNGGSGSFSLLHNTGGVFDLPLALLSGGSIVRALAIGDFDGDLRPDAAVLNGGSSSFSVFLNVTAFLRPPSDLTARAVSATRIDLAWSPGDPNALEYQIERRNGLGLFAIVGTVPAGTLKYNDTAVGSTTTYTYRVRAFNDDLASAYTNQVSATTLFAPPTAPINLRITPISGVSLRVAWSDTSPNELGFRLERKSSGGWVQIGQPIFNVTTLDDTSLSARTTYSYRVRAYNQGGTSPYSNEATATTGDPRPPLPPGDLVGQAVSSTEVDLSWEDTSADELGFEIERNSGNGIYERIGSIGPNESVFLDTTADPETAYIYRVRSFGFDGASAPSGGSNVRTLAAPGGFTALAASSAQVLLNWTDLSTHETGYVVERKTGNGSGQFVQLARLAAGATVYSDVTVTANTTYNYRVRAFNTSGTSSPGEAPPVPVLGGPTGLSAAGISSSRVHLTWTDGSGAEEGFRIERKATGGSYQQVGTAPKNAAAYDDTGLTPATAYTYRVRAYNSAGNSSYSNEKDASTYPLPPAAPGNLQVTALSTSQLKVSWGDGAANEDGFKVERKSASGAWLERIVLPANTLSWTEGGLAADSAYTYRVRAYNLGGASAFTAEATGRTRPPPPGAPLGVGATVLSPFSVKVTWVAGGRQDGFELERRTDGTAYALLRKPEVGETAFTDSGLKPQTRYTYRLRAFNRGGFSAYSAEAAATTPPDLPPPPAAPTGLTAQASSSMLIHLAWSDQSSNEGQFKLERRVGAGGWQPLAAVGANVTSYDDNGLQPSTLYTYRVRASNAGGDSALSNEAAATTLPRLRSFAVAPTAVKGGKPASVTAVLTGPAPAGGVVVTLSSSSAAAKIAAGATVPAGKDRVTITVKTKKVKKPARVTLSAAYAGVTLRATLTLRK